jgi:hypothetical protein
MKKTTLTTIVLVLIFAVFAYAQQADQPNPDPWPRTVELSAVKYTLYQPQQLPQNLDREQQARNMGQQRAESYHANRPAGGWGTSGSRPSRGGSYGGSRGGGRGR